MSINVEVNAGLDIGNGYVKGLVAQVGQDAEMIDVPSAATKIVSNTSILVTSDKIAEEIESDFYNKLDIGYDSPLVTNSYRHLLGKRALSARGSLMQFDVVGKASKSEQELAQVLVLGLLAGKCVKDYYNEHNELPDDIINANVSLALALPINEFTQHRYAYASKFENGNHLISVKNFEKTVQVRVNIKHAYVLAEGVSAYFAILSKGEALMNAMLDDVRSHGLALEGITAQDVLNATNTIGIDIGEGTVNFPVTIQAKFNPEASLTFDKGYGNVLEDALYAMEAENYSSGFASRKELAEFLLKEPTVLTKARYEKASDFVNAQLELLSDEITAKFGQVLSTVGGIIEVVYVYGGGSGPFKDILYPKLLAKLNEMNSGSTTPVMYLDSKYSRNLNSVGLYTVALNGA